MGEVHQTYFGENLDYSDKEDPDVAALWEMRNSWGDSHASMYSWAEGQNFTRSVVKNLLKEIRIIDAMQTHRFGTSSYYHKKWLQEKEKSGIQNLPQETTNEDAFKTDNISHIGMDVHSEAKRVLDNDHECKVIPFRSASRR